MLGANVKMLQLIVLQVKRGSREEDEDAIAGYREKGKKRRLGERASQSEEKRNR